MKRVPFEPPARPTAMLPKVEDGAGGASSDAIAAYW